MTFRMSFISALVVIVATTAIAADQPVSSYTYLSPVYTIAKKYRSMEGPGYLERIYLGDREKPEILWIVGVRTEMVGEDGKTPQLPELMCHVNVDFDTKLHSALFNLKRFTAPRLITLSQGMVSARFPDGFGMPIASNEPLAIFTQVLNHNIEKPDNLKVRHRVTFDYIRDSELKTPMTALFNVGASGTVLLQDPLALASMTTASIPVVDAGNATMTSSASKGEGHDAHGTSCLLAARAPNATAASADYSDPQGRKVTGHWVVPPGRQVNHSDVTWFMGLPYDAKLHFAAAHLHPFAKSLTIRDLTTGQTVFELRAKGVDKGIGLSAVDTFTSREGVKLYKSHRYELVSDYDNTTSENVDSMASAFLAFADPEFVKPDAATLAQRAAQYQK